MNKVYLPVAGRRVASWSLDAFHQVPEIGVLLLVIRPEDADLAAEVTDGLDVELVHGGRTRQESELNALRHLASRIADGSVDAVLIHDAARPLVSPALIGEVLRVTREHGGAVPGLAAHDIVPASETATTGGFLADAVRVQTPQGFLAKPLLEVYEQAEREGFLGTDTASCMEKFSPLPVRWVPGREENFKITYPHDLTVAEQVLTGSW